MVGFDSDRPACRGIAPGFFLNTEYPMTKQELPDDIRRERLAAQKRVYRDRQRAKRNREWQKQLAQSARDRSDGRGRVGDLSDSVDRAFWRVCG